MKKLNLIRRQIIELRQRQPLRAFMGLFPPIDWKRPMDETVHKHIPQELHDLAPES
jgi:hypothetical protein